VLPTGGEIVAEGSLADLQGDFDANILRINRHHSCL